VLRAGRYEDGVAAPHRAALARDLDLSVAVEHEIELVEHVGGLLVLLRRHEDVHADLETGRGVHDVEPASVVTQACCCLRDLEALHGRDRTRLSALPRPLIRILIFPLSTRQRRRLAAVRGGLVF
jgi:hypothetical protein